MGSTITKKQPPGNWEENLYAEVLAWGCFVFVHRRVPYATVRIKRCQSAKSYIQINTM